MFPINVLVYVIKHKVCTQAAKCYEMGSSENERRCLRFLLNLIFILIRGQEEVFASVTPIITAASFEAEQIVCFFVLSLTVSHHAMLAISHTRSSLTISET